MKNYFEILGVSENATDEEIKKQYRILSKKYHPDVNPEGGDKFKDIAEAYDVLSDPQKKNKYMAQKNNPFGVMVLLRISSRACLGKIQDSTIEERYLIKSSRWVFQY